VLPLTSQAALKAARDIIASAGESAATHEHMSLAQVHSFEEQHARKRLQCREQQEFAVIITLTAHELRNTVLRPLAKHISDGEVESRAQLHRVEVLERRQLEAAWRGERHVITPKQPVPPKNPPRALRPSTWIEQRRPIVVPPLILEAEVQARFLLESDESNFRAALREERNACRLRAEVDTSRRRHELRLAQWRDERETRDRQQRSLAAVVAGMLRLEEEESAQRDASELAATSALAGLRAGFIDDVCAIARQRVFREWLSGRRTMWCQDAIAGRLLLLEQHEAGVRRELWLEERLRCDMEIFRERQLQLRTMHVQSMTSRESVLKIQRFFRLVLAGRAGWRRSHKVAGERIQAQRSSRSRRGIVEAARADVALARAELAAELECEVQARHGARHVLEEKERQSRVAVIADERWWLLSQLEAARASAVLVFRPFLLQTINDEAATRRHLREMEQNAVAEHTLRCVEGVRYLNARSQIFRGEASQRDQLVSAEAEQFAATVLSEFGPQTSALLSRLAAETAQAAEIAQRRLYGDEAGRRWSVLQDENGERSETFAPCRVHGPVVEMQYDQSLHRHRFLVHWQIATRSDATERLLAIHETLSEELQTHYLQLAKQAQRQGISTLEMQRRNALSTSEAHHWRLLTLLWTESRAQVVAFHEKRSKAAAVIQKATRSGRRGQLGHRGTIAFLRSSFAIKRETIMLRRDHDALKRYADVSRAELQQAVSEDRAAAAETLREHSLQLSRAEQWARKTISDEEDFIRAITMRNLSNVRLDEVDAKARSTKEAEMDARRGIKKLELTAWEDLTRKHRDGRYTVTIRPGQRAMRCYLARKRRRERVVLVFAELPAREHRARAQLTADALLTMREQQRDVIYWPFSQQLFELQCAEIFASDDCTRLVAVADRRHWITERATQLEATARADTWQEEAAAFTHIVTVAQSDSLRRVDLALIELSQRELIHREECSARLRKFVEAHEVAVRAALETTLLQREAPRSAIEVEECASRATLAHASERRYRGELMEQHENFRRARLVEAENGTWASSLLTFHESTQRRVLDEGALTAVARSVAVLSDGLRSAIDHQERNARNLLRVEASEDDARNDVRLQLLRMWLAATEHEETTYRLAIESDRELVAVISNASIVDEAIRSKANLFASFLLNDDVSAMLQYQREFRTPPVAAEETSCRAALHTLECVARLGAVAAHEGRERSGITFDEQVWRERICAAVEARAAHAAAQTIQAAWEKRQRRHNPNYSSKRDLKARQQFVDASLHSHTSVCLTMLRDVGLLAMTEHESIHRLAVEKAAYTAASHVFAEAAAHLASMREAAARRASDARRSIEAEEVSARGAVAADFACCWQSYLKEFAVRSAEVHIACLAQQHADYVTTCCVHLEGYVRSEISRLCTAAARAVQQSASSRALQLHHIDSHEAIARRDVEDQRATAMAQLRDLWQLNIHHRQLLGVDEDSARFLIEEAEASAFAHVTTVEWHAELQQARRRAINRGTIRLQRWWRRRSMLDDATGVAEALYVRDGLAAERAAAMELRDFGEAVNDSTVVIQSAARGWLVRRRGRPQQSRRRSSDFQL
jgi:hypothetical protein